MGLTMRFAIGQPGQVQQPLARLVNSLYQSHQPNVSSSWDC